MFQHLNPREEDTDKIVVNFSTKMRELVKQTVSSEINIETLNKELLNMNYYIKNKDQFIDIKFLNLFERICKLYKIVFLIIYNNYLLLL